MTDLAPVIPLHTHRKVEAELTYPQLANAVGLGIRTLKQCKAEGMPDIGLDYAGRRRFLLSAVIEWLDERNRRMGRNA